MDIFDQLSEVRYAPIKCIDMHTAGEPTRIVISGYPDLSGTLLEQREQAKREYDHIRRKLMLEPRGHADMYGAILRQKTELVESGEADIGVLFMTNEGYSTMCGHATIALGRFLVETRDRIVFPNGDKIVYDSASRSTRIRLHTPCGLVVVNVPVNLASRSWDWSLPIDYTSVECFVTGITVPVQIPKALSWPELKDRDLVDLDVAYGGAFYGIISAQELGFNNGLLDINLKAVDLATRNLKAAITSDRGLRYLYTHPSHEELSFLYSIIVVDNALGDKEWSTSAGAETGLCFFANQQIDRSPTGSGVSARLALAHAKGRLKPGDKWTYHSLTTLPKSKAAFCGSVSEVTAASHHPRVKTIVWGSAYYTGNSTFSIESTDVYGDDGFLMSDFEHYEPEKKN